MTGLDEFRFAMTGGNRYRDLADLTVLERTYQDGQGGTSNFPNKTFTGSGATPFDTVTIANQGKGVAMVLSGAGDGVNCTSPARSGSAFSCDMTLQSNGAAGSCTTWTGSGTDASPYTCTALGAFAGNPAFASITPETKSNATTNADTTVTCSNPTHNGTTFSCTLTDSSGNLGSCIMWTGSGLSAADPFTCATFGTFSGGVAFSGTATAASTFVKTTAAQSKTDNGPSCSFTNAPTRKVACQLSTGNTATCTNIVGTGASNKRYRCDNGSNWTSSGGGTGFSHTNGVDGVVAPNIYYRLPSSISYTAPGSSTTYHYRTTYAGSNTASYYYYSTYNVSLSGTQALQVRVKVCDPAVGLESNCRQYGTSYKPTGVVQDNGDRMRFGVFSYYKSDDIDNAVMRSKLKYVAPEKFVVGGGTVSNPNAEWNSSGVLVTNPDSAEASASYGGAVSNSGVINYVNKFGTTGSGTTRYKKYDNIGKLYYESLNYLRGRGPTSAFYSNSSTTNNDNFPVISSWDDPQEFFCQKNYLITMGDMHTWCDKRLPGGQFTETLNGVCNAKNGQADDKGSLSGDSGVDVAAWTNKIGTKEGISNPTLALKPAGVGNASYNMSGLAYWARINDIRLMTRRSRRPRMRRPSRLL